MDPATLLQKLQINPPAELAAREVAAREVQENVFQVCAGRQSFLVKWIVSSSARGQNELRIGRLFRRFKVVPAPRLLFEMRVDEGTLAGWEWIEGHDLRERGRENLLDAFSRLGELHLQLRNHAKVVTPLGGDRYGSVSELLASEAYRLCAPFDAATRERCARMISRLEAGYPTLIHGDMHPGNIMIARQQVWLIDWSYACNSLNLFDLDYISSSPLPADGPAWSQITPQEAVLVLPAYFQAAGLGQVNYFETHQAVMVWGVLRTYENSVKNGYRAELPLIREHLQTLLQEE